MLKEALSRYNRGTPDYRGIGDPNYIQRVFAVSSWRTSPRARKHPKPGMMARVSTALSPASAEASTPAANCPECYVG